MIETNNTVIATFVVYLLVVLAIGIVAYRLTSSLSDYILGGRRLGKWTTALSAQASDMSGWLLLGLPGAAYASGLSAGWIALGLAIGTYFNWRFIAKRLRQFTQHYGDAITLPDYFENRFNDSWGALRIISAIVILVFFTFYTSSGLVAGAKLFETVFGLEYHIALAVGAGVVLVYTLVGGFLAVSWTDAMQGTLMFFALLIVVGIAVAVLGGPGGAEESIRAVQPNMLDPFMDNGEALGWMALISSLAWGLGYLGQPHILARFMAIDNAESIKASRWIAMTWVVISLAAAVLVGMLGRAYLDQPLEDNETVFMFLANTLLHPIPAGIALAGILAAVMSTADSQLLVASSALSEDFYKGLFRKDATQGELLWVGRGAVVLIAIVAMVFAWERDSKVLDLVSYAWAGFGAAFGPTILLSLFWPAMSRAGALAGMVVGAATVIIWKQLSGGLFDLYELVPGFIFAVIAIIVASLIAPPDAATRAEAPQT